MLKIKLNPDGTLRGDYASQLIKTGLLSRYATLKIPGYDVDSGASPKAPKQPEVDIVSFNGKKVRDHSGRLNGIDNEWKINSYRIPITEVKFAWYETHIDKNNIIQWKLPSGGNNQVRIDIDTANANNNLEVWCIEVDWATLSFKAMSPIILMHGLGETGKFFEKSGFMTEPEKMGLVVDNFIRINPTSFANSGLNINSQLPQVIRSYDVDSIHFVAHSKGGLDLRNYLAVHHHSNSKDFKILSYTSLSTPHNGSVFGDLLEAYKEVEKTT